MIHELAVAARTDEKLRDTLRDVMTAYIAKIYEDRAARSLPDEIDGSRRDENSLADVGLVLSSFDGAAHVPACAESAGDSTNAQIPFWLSLLGRRP